MTGSSESIFSMALNSGFIVGGVLLTLLICSVATWGIIIYKVSLLRKAGKENKEFFKIFWASTSFSAVSQSIANLKNSPTAEVFRAGHSELKRAKISTSAPETMPGDFAIKRGKMESLERTLRQSAEAESARLNTFLVFLATVASASPFIGLFGTVWGIMESFRSIGQTGSANLAVVAPGISEALIATAAGLAAAIPAVIAFNFLKNTINTLAVDTDSFITEFLNIVNNKIGG